MNYFHIQINNQDIDLVRQSNVFIYGSLVCRNLISKHTLLELLTCANFKVFDVNLREPHYTFELLNELMQKADFIKFNDDELELIARELNSGHDTLEENMIYISKKFNARYICVTKGSEGALLLVNGQFYFNNGYKIIILKKIRLFCYFHCFHEFISVLQISGLLRYIIVFLCLVSIPL